MTAPEDTRPETLEQLVAVLGSLADMAPERRVLAARALDKVARRILAEVGDAATFELATEVDDLGRRRRKHADVARLIGVSHYRVNHAVTQHRQRLEEQAAAAAG